MADRVCGTPEDVVFAIETKKQFTLANTLKELDLGWSITKSIIFKFNIASGVRSISDSLQVNSTLTTLNLGENKIGSDGAQSISDSLKVNSTLTTLNLEQNDIWLGGAKSISDSLKVNSTLTTLNIS